MSVVFEHFCETSAHNAFGYTYSVSFPAHVMLRLMYGIARTAVPVFFILSGYLSVTSTKQKFGKGFNLYFMTLAYSFIPQVASFGWNLLHGNFVIPSLGISQILASNYYLYLFCAVYILSPFINKMVASLSKNQYRNLIIFAVLLFSVWSTVINTVASLMGNDSLYGVYFTSRTGTSMGFNVANFLTMYLVGGYLRLHYIKNAQRDRIIALLAILSSTVITSIGKLLSTRLSKAFLYYDSIFVVLAAIAVVVLFLNINIPSSKMISLFAINTYGTYLLHGFANTCVEKVITIEKVVSRGFAGTLLGILIFVVGVYLLSLVMNMVIQYATKPINNIWKKTKIFNLKFMPED